LINKTILITGGSGSLGTALVKEFLKYNVKAIRVFSRNESMQYDLRRKFKDERLKIFLGDVRDRDRVFRAMEGVDIVIHAAALKHVDLIEYNPFEALKTNCLGSQNIIDAALDFNIEKVIAISSDKAVNPVNTYGASKLLMEKLLPC